jgi:hypothetical protein
MNPDSYRDQTPMLVRVFNRKVREDFSEGTLDFFARNGTRSQSFFNNIVISTKEKSSRVALQRLAYWNGVTCEDFSFVEMTRLRSFFALFCFRLYKSIRENSCNSWQKNKHKKNPKLQS